MILVTGGTGFIGGHIVRKLCSQQLAVRVLARSSSPLEPLRRLPVEIVTGDLGDRKSLPAAVKGCEAVYHVAADYRLWSAHPAELYRSNMQGTENLLAEAFAAGVRRVVYTSTVGTIGFHADGSPVDERDFPDPSHLAGHYKRSKFEAEKVALRYAQEGREVVIVNPTAPIGEEDRKPTDTGKIILDFLNRRMPAYIDTGLNLADVRDVADGHIAAMERGRPGERYILGGENMTLREILQALARITGLPAPCLRLPYAFAICAGAVDTAVANLTGKPPRVPLEGVKMARYKMFVTSDKAERELGYQRGSVQAALQRAVDWFRAHGMAA